MPALLASLSLKLILVFYRRHWSVLLVCNHVARQEMCKQADQPLTQTKRKT
jgi:hypothetical protein